MNDSGTSAGALETLHRLRDSELDQAKAECASVESTLRQREQSVRILQAEIDHIQGRARQELGAEQGLAADRWRAVNAYGLWQSQMLRERVAALRKAEERVEQARAQAMQLFRQVSMLERLLERRAHAAAQEQGRRAQREFDEHASQGHVPNLDSSRPTTTRRTPHGH